VTGSTYGAGTYGSASYGGYPPADPEPFHTVQVGGAAGDWRDVTCDARGWTIDRGRTGYSDSFRAGTLTLELYNPAGVYSTAPSYSVWRTAAGFVTGVPIRVGVVRLGDVSWRFTGTTDAVDESWPGTVDAVAVVTATDAFKSLARRTGLARAPVGAGERSGARVNRILDDHGYTGPRAVDVGAVTVAATTLAGITLDQLRVIGESEWGWLYVRGDGALVFRQRDAAASDPRMTAAQFVFTDSDGIVGACYGDATVIAATDAHVVNVAQITPAGSSTVSTFTDPASAAQFGARTYSRTDLPLTADVDAAALAQLVVNTYKGDGAQIDAVTIDAAHRPTAWPAAADCRITDRVRFVRTLPGGWQLDADLLVQGRRDVVVAGGDGRRPDTWDVTFATASASSVANLGKWDVGQWDLSKFGV
jgi:hypothetical protein